MTGSAMIGGCDARVDALRAEFGGILAERILEAEALDFIWEARVRERYLGQHVGDGLSGGDDQDLSRIAVLSWLDGRWQVAVLLVDGEGDAAELVWRRRLGSYEEAEHVFYMAR
jgi:hypothetical protein